MKIYFKDKIGSFHCKKTGMKITPRSIKTNIGDIYYLSDNKRELIESMKINTVEENQFKTNKLNLKNEQSRISSQNGSTK